MIWLLIGMIGMGFWTMCRLGEATDRVGGLADEVVQLRERLKEQDFELALYKKTDDGEERQRRVYYQNTVYAVAREFDMLLLRSPGNGLVCGTIESPASQVEEVAAFLVAQLLTMPGMPGLRTRLRLAFPPPTTSPAPLPDKTEDAVIDREAFLRP